MAYASLASCVADLEKTGRLRRVDVQIDPVLEAGAIQRRALAAGAPALLFTNVKGTGFPLLANLFGTKERVEFLFRDSLDAVKEFFALAADPAAALRHPLKNLPRLGSALAGGLHALTRRIAADKAPVLACSCQKDALPRLVSWPKDGGAFITLPLVYSEDPDAPGAARANLGMYRIQISGNDYGPDEAGLHYQTHRGIGVHHAHALAKGIPLPVHVYVGGPPALTLAAVMPLPEGISELTFAGMLGGRGVALARSKSFSLPVLAEADFCISGFIAPAAKPEGPFGDHMGYYSLRHDFPVLKITGIHHRRNAVWPFTTVGRPPQEDTVFGDFIHEITGPLIGKVFSGVSEVHAVDAAGVHPLLLAMGHERYVPWEALRRPRELLTQAMHLLGTSQTALAKYLLITAGEDAPGLSCRDVPAFLRHMLERTDFSRDLHFITAATADTLDYTGTALNEGSKLIWASAGERRRELDTEMRGLPDLPDGFADPHLAGPGMLVVRGPKNTAERGAQSADMARLAQALTGRHGSERLPLVVVADDPAFCAARLENFLWVTFTRSDPAADVYGAAERTVAKHWLCDAPLLIDARVKPFHAPVLEEDPDVTRRVEALAAPGGPLHGCW
ncbi:MAG: UbiD family decarboxylase [Desulfovibrio sp.]|nr:UbiD family decarboxylase [Desulfovibrio sp.]